jgi:hypothetical protein
MLIYCRLFYFSRSDPFFHYLSGYFCVDDGLKKWWEMPANVSLPRRILISIRQVSSYFLSFRLTLLCGYCVVFLCCWFCCATSCCSLLPCSLFVRSKDWGEGYEPVYSIPCFLPCFLKVLFRFGDREKHCRLSTQLEGQCSNDVLSIGLNS